MRYKVRFMEIGNVIEVKIRADGFYMNKDNGEASVTFYNNTDTSDGCQVSVHAFSNFISIVKIEK